MSILTAELFYHLQRLLPYRCWVHVCYMNEDLSLRHLVARWGVPGGLAFSNPAVSQVAQPNAKQSGLPGAEASAEDQVTLSVQPCFHRKLARQAKNKSQVLQLVCFTL